MHSLHIMSCQFVPKATDSYRWTRFCEKSLSIFKQAEDKGIYLQSFDNYPPVLDVEGGIIFFNGVGEQKGNPIWLFRTPHAYYSQEWQSDITVNGMPYAEVFYVMSIVARQFSIYSLSLRCISDHGKNFNFDLRDDKKENFNELSELSELSELDLNDWHINELEIPGNAQEYFNNSHQLLIDKMPELFEDQTRTPRWQEKHQDGNDMQVEHYKEMNIADDMDILYDLADMTKV